MSDSESRRGCGMFGAGCGVTILILIVGVAALVFFAYRKAPDIAGSVLTKMVSEMELPPDQELQIVERIEDLKTEYKAGNISKERIFLLGEQLSKSPIFHCALLRLAETKYIAPSGLTQEEKDTGTRTLQRLARGVFENKITGEDLDRAVSPLRNEDGDLQQSISDENLRAFLVLATREVEKAEIEDAPFEIDLAAEINKTVDQVLGKAPAEAPPVAETPSSESTEE